MRGVGRRSRAAGAVLVVLAATALSAATSDAAQPAAATCRSSTVAVAPAQQLFVKACVPSRGPTPSTVQVLVHGITYDHRYWDLHNPQRPGESGNSWQDAAARAGYATVAVDRLGSGRSTHPRGDEVTADSNAAAIAAVVTALRAGEVATPAGRLAFGRVLLVGHSYGSTIALLTAAQYRNVDGLVLTGYTNGARLAAHAAALAAFHPVGQDPALRGRGLDDGYLTTRPGTRESLFYAPATDVAPEILTQDEAFKGTVTRAEFATFAPLPSLRSTVPMLILVGARDGIFCAQAREDGGADCTSGATLAAQERTFYPVARSVEAVVVPGLGHALNAFRGAGVAFTAATRWIDRMFPAR